MSAREFNAETRIDADLVRAIAWCRIGGPGTRPHNDAAFARAEELGLLAHDPTWRATPQGEGVLIALGFLDPTWEKGRTKIVALWAREPREGAPAQFVAAWSESFTDLSHETYREEKEEAERRWREWPGGESGWVFWATTEEIARP